MFTAMWAYIDYILLQIIAIIKSTSTPFFINQDLIADQLQKTVLWKYTLFGCLLNFCVEQSSKVILWNLRILLYNSTQISSLSCWIYKYNIASIEEIAVRFNYLCL